MIPLDARMQGTARELAASYLGIATSHVGRCRDDFEEACDGIEVQPHNRRLADGVRKLVEDRCEFDAELAIDPADLRRSVFLQAGAARREGAFDRSGIIDAGAAQHELSPEALERALYADLRGAHLLRKIAPIGVEQLVLEYDLAQHQAVLLRAVQITVDVSCETPGAYRALFRKLKFLRLLHRIEEIEAGGYRIEIDGPFSLFESVTKYGLQLALVLPALRECDAFKLKADVRWGKDRAPLTFRLEERLGGPTSHDREVRLPDEVAALLKDVRALKSPWNAAPATAILNLPGVGLCVPDLVFEHAETGECIYLEIMGFWSRDAVWRRIELVEQGLAENIIFAVSKHLRVSEQALGDELPGALYVYKRVMIARTVVERVDRLSRLGRNAGGNPA